MGKKKKKPVKTNAQRLKNLYKTIDYRDNQNTCLMLPTIIYGTQEDFANSVMESTFAKTMLHSRPEMKAAVLSQESVTASIIKTMIDNYIQNHPVDNNLNIYDNQAAINTSADMLDFTQFESNKNILTDAVMSLRDYDTADLSILWSTQEYIHIRYSSSIEYAIKNLGYDSDKNNIRYEIIGFESRILFKNETITTPCFIAEIAVKLVNISDAVISEHDENTKTWANIQTMQDLIQNCSHNYVFPEITLIKSNMIEDFDTYCAHYADIISAELNIQKLPYPKKFIQNIMTMLWLDMFDAHRFEKSADNNNDEKSIAEETAYYNGYLLQKLSIAFACIIVTNAMLATEKIITQPVNKPNKTSHTIAATVEENASITDTRRIRHIGKIKIKSNKKPTQPTMQRIIKYNLAEWQRKGYFRHYKNGKVVEIKPTTVHRQCVNATNLIKKTVPKPVNYIIHSTNKINH